MFRGVREMTKEEVEEAQRESRRSRREHLRTAKLLEKQQQQQQQRGGGKLNILPSPTTTTSAVSAVGGVMTAEQQRKQQVTTLTAATLAAHSQVQQMTMKGRQPPPPLLTRGLSSVSFEDDVMAAEGTPTAALAGAEEKSSHKYIGISDYYDGDSAAGAEEVYFALFLFQKICSLRLISTHLCLYGHSIATCQSNYTAT